MFGFIFISPLRAVTTWHLREKEREREKETERGRDFEEVAAGALCRVESPVSNRHKWLSSE